MLTSCLQEQASKDVVACQVAWPPAGPLDNRTATTGAANRHLFGFDRNRVRFEPESLFAITGMRIELRGAVVLVFAEGDHFGSEDSVGVLVGRH